MTAARVAGTESIQCGSKSRYRTSHQAKQRMKRLAARNGGPILQVYRCPHCNYWHAGNPFYKP